MHKGFFLSFEGVDGTGKSTQIGLLADALKFHGYSIYQTKEPGDARSGSNVGAGVRELLFKNPSTKNMAPGVSDMLFLADHIQNASDIRGRLRNGEVIITDRYADSQFAYAASDSRRCPAWVLKIYRDQFGPVPDATVLLLVQGTDSPDDIGWALERANARRGVEAGKQDGKTWNSVQEQLIIQNGYLDLIGSERRTIPIWVTEDDQVGSIHARIFSAVHARMLNRDTIPQMALPMYEGIPTSGAIQ